MAWLTAASAVMGVGGSLLQGFGQNAAIDAANKAAKANAKLTSAYDGAQFQLGQMQQMTQYAWDKAQVAQLQAVEAKNAMDQAKYGKQLIANATENYKINKDILFDQFVTQEKLRATQVGLESSYQQATLAAQTGNIVGQYMSDINAAGLQGTAFLQQAQNDVTDLLGTMALEEQRDNLGWQLRKLEAMEADSQAKATAYVRQGGGNTAKRLAMQGAVNLGRIYGELSLKADSRNLKLRLLNTAINTEGATQMAQLALKSQAAVENMNYAINKYKTDSKLATDQLKKLTIPSFGLANKQYTNELKSLQLQTKSIYQKALTPYTQKEYLGPIAPLGGIAPMATMPSLQQKQSGWSMFGSAVIAGAKGALSGAQKVQNQDGTWSTTWL